MSCQITPITAFQSTNLNSKIDCFGRLGDRIVRSLGAPIVTVELAQDQLFENISIACEMFSKYAGYTREYLVFDSRLYERGRGIRLDHLFTLANDNLTLSEKLQHNTLSNTTSYNYEVEKMSYIVNYPIGGTIFSTNSSLSSDLSAGLIKNQILDETTYALLTSNYKLSSFFTPSSTIYTTYSAYHDSLYAVPSSNFTGVLSTFTLSVGEHVNQSKYTVLSSNLSTFEISTFFKTNSSFTLVNNSIPLSVFSDNVVLSSIITVPFSANDIFSTSSYPIISSNLSGIGVNYFLSYNVGDYYETTTPINSSIFVGYNTLSASFSHGLSANQIVVLSSYALLSSVGSFKLSSFFSTGYNMKECTTPINSALFADNNELSAAYPNGIELGDLFLSTNINSINNVYFGTLSSLNLSIPRFFNSYTLSTLHIDVYYTALNSIPSIFLSAGSVIPESTYNQTDNEILTSFFTHSYNKELVTCGTENAVPSTIYNNMFDYDLMSYRKVISITDFEEGSTTGINTLFTIEQTLAQQTYFSYAMGNYGFDLISWYCVKNWLETREKVLAIRRSYDFDDRTQMLRIYPEPNQNVSTFYGLLPCYVERKLSDLIKEPWVYQYALALCKITLGRNRGKYAGTQMFGGQMFDLSVLQEGLTEKEKLETKLYEGADAGLYGEGFVGMFIG